jgi:nucleoside-diphosphate-sugar epimerase
VVLTSSIAAVKDSSNEKYGVNREIGYVWSERDFNETSTVETNAYSFSKVTAEKAAWSLVEGTKIKLVTINPAFVLGPVLSARTDATSVKTILGLVTGGFKDGVPGAFCFGSCDVRDVCLAHIGAAEVESASGRYLVTTAHSNPMLKLAEMVGIKYKDEFPLIPTTANGDVPEPNMRHKMDASKTEKDLGFKLSFGPQTLHDMVESFKTFGLV